MSIGNPSKGLRLAMSYPSTGNRISCTIACGKGRVLRSSPLKVRAGINSFCEKLRLGRRGIATFSAICRRSQVGTSRVRCQTGRLLYSFIGNRKGGIRVAFHIDGGSITFHCALPERRKGKDIAIGDRQANFHFPSRAAAFLYPRDSTVVK